MPYRVLFIQIENIILVYHYLLSFTSCVLCLVGKFLFEPFPVESSLHKALHEHINAEIVTGVLTSLQDCLEFISWTYYFRRLAINPSFYQLTDSSSEGVAKHLKELLQRVLKDLETAGCVVIKDDSLPSSASNTEQPELTTTTLGQITSQYYLCYRTTRLFEREVLALCQSFSSLALDGLFEHYTRLLSSAFEFSEVPVRHNEDKLNAELMQHEDMPWKVDEEDCGESNVKAFLLIQAHLYRVPLPIVDYLTDSKLVLDQAPRVLNALVDVTVYLKKYRVIVALMKLAQFIAAGVAPIDVDNRSPLAPEFRQFPGGLTDGEALAKCFKKRGMRDLSHLLNAVSMYKMDMWLQEDVKSPDFPRVAFLNYFRELPRVRVALRLLYQRSSGVSLGALSTEGGEGGDSAAVPAAGEIVSIEVLLPAKGGGVPRVVVPRSHQGLTLEVRIDRAASEDRRRGGGGGGQSSGPGRRNPKTALSWLLALGSGSIPTTTTTQGRSAASRAGANAAAEVEDLVFSQKVGSLGGEQVVSIALSSGDSSGDVGNVTDDARRFCLQLLCDSVIGLDLDFLFDLTISDE